MHSEASGERSSVTNTSVLPVDILFFATTCRKVYGGSTGAARAGGDERRIPLAGHPSAPTVHAVGYVRRSVQNTEERRFGLLACIVGILVVQWLLRWLNW